MTVRASCGTPSSKRQTQDVLVVSLLLLLLLSERCAAFSICVLNGVEGFGSCNSSTDSRTWTGYEVEMFRWIANTTMGWREDPQGGNASVESGVYAFRCAAPEWVSMVTNLTQPDFYSSCAAAVGAITISYSRAASGVQFSSGWYRSSLATVMYAPPASDTATSYWGFLKPFTWDLWLAFLLMLFCVPSLVWFVERLNLTGRIPLTRSSVDEWHAATYLTMLSYFNLDVYPATALPAQLLIFSFAFMILIIVSTYTANLAALLTAGNSSTAVVFTDPSSLRGQAVSTEEVYQARLQSLYGLYTSTTGWRGSLSFDVIAQQLRNGTLKAHIDDAPLLQFFINKDGNCSLVSFGASEAVEIDYGVAFHSEFPTALVDNFDVGIIDAQERLVSSRLQAQYISTGTTCADPTTQAYTSLTFTQLMGLWIILGIAAGAALLYTFCVIGWKVYKYAVEDASCDTDRSATNFDLSEPLHAALDSPGAACSSPGGTQQQPSSPLSSLGLSSCPTMLASPGLSPCPTMTHSCEMLLPCLPMPLQPLPPPPLLLPATASMAPGLSPCASLTSQGSAGTPRATFAAVVSPGLPPPQPSPHSLWHASPSAFASAAPSRPPRDTQLYGPMHSSASVSAPPTTTCVVPPPAASRSAHALLQPAAVPQQQQQHVQQQQPPIGSGYRGAIQLVSPRSPGGTSRQAPLDNVLQTARMVESPSATSLVDHAAAAATVNGGQSRLQPATGTGAQRQPQPAAAKSSTRTPQGVVAVVLADSCASTSAAADGVRGAVAAAPGSINGATAGGGSHNTMAVAGVSSDTVAAGPYVAGRTTRGAGGPLVSAGAGPALPATSSTTRSSPFASAATIAEIAPSRTTSLLTSDGVAASPFLACGSGTSTNQVTTPPPTAVNPTNTPHSFARASVNTSSPFNGNSSSLTAAAATSSSSPASNNPSTHAPAVAAAASRSPLSTATSLTAAAAASSPTSNTTTLGAAPSPSLLSIRMASWQRAVSKVFVSARAAEEADILASAAASSRSGRYGPRNSSPGGGISDPTFAGTSSLYYQPSMGRSPPSRAASLARPTHGGTPSHHGNTPSHQQSGAYGTMSPATSMSPTTAAALLQGPSSHHLSSPVTADAAAISMVTLPLPPNVALPVRNGIAGGAVLPRQDSITHSTTTFSITATGGPNAASPGPPTISAISNMPPLQLAAAHQNPSGASAGVPAGCPANSPSLFHSSGVATATSSSQQPVSALSVMASHNVSPVRPIPARGPSPSVYNSNNGKAGVFADQGGVFGPSWTP